MNGKMSPLDLINNNEEGAEINVVSNTFSSGVLACPLQPTSTNGILWQCKTTHHCQSMCTSLRCSGSGQQRKSTEFWLAWNPTYHLIIELLIMDCLCKFFWKSKFSLILLPSWWWAWQPLKRWLEHKALASWMMQIKLIMQINILVLGH